MPLTRRGGKKSFRQWMKILRPVPVKPVRTGATVTNRHRHHSPHVKSEPQAKQITPKITSLCNESGVWRGLCNYRDQAPNWFGSERRAELGWQVLTGGRTVAFEYRIQRIFAGSPTAQSKKAKQFSQEKKAVLNGFRTGRDIPVCNMLCSLLD